jgi:hypothetical protein
MAGSSSPQGRTRKVRDRNDMRQQKAKLGTAKGRDSNYLLTRDEDIEHYHEHAKGSMIK